MKNKNRNIIIATLTTLALAAIGSAPTFAETAKYHTEVAPALKITIPNTEINVAVDPSSRPFDSRSFNITVATNNLTGYNLTMASESTSLLKTDDVTKTIQTLSTLEGGYTEDTFENNKWGYKLASTNYIPFVSGAEIARSDTTTNGDTTQLTFATKVDFLQSAGVYKNELNFVAVANPLPTYIQNLDATMCTEDPLLVVDKRDNEEYLVQRLADGNCWMLDNLRLDPTEVELASLKGNTNATDEVLAYFKNGGGESPYPVNGVSSEWTSSSQNSYVLPYINAGYKNTVASTTYGIGSGKIGVRYNYCAASAGSYCYDASSGTGNAAYDICPAGWRLPVGGTTLDPVNEFNNLYLAYDSDHVAYKTALSLLLSGGGDGGSGSGGAYGYFWSSAPSGSSSISTYAMGILRIHPQYATPGDSYFRYYGGSVRCLLRPSLNSAVYLQDVTPEMVNTTEIGTTKTLKDRRDNEEYLVGKLADGNLWLLDNLRLDPTQVSLENLKGNTNATDESLTALKNGGGEGQYAVNAIVSGTALSTQTRTSGFVSTSYVDTIPPTTSGFASSKAGVYYNYCAASAGSYCYDRVPTMDDQGGSVYVSATEDICPSGWRLPIERGLSGAYSNNSVVELNSEIWDLVLAYDGDISAVKTAFNIAASGGYYSNYDPPVSWGSTAYWWSSTMETNYSMKGADIYSSYSQFGTDRERAFSVRCIFNK